MALRARLVAPPPAPSTEWPWHKAKVASLPVHLMWGGDRRMEAENYLASGYGIRLSIKERSTGWVPLSTYANVWQPSRLKGILVSPDSGTPFLAATQVFDLRPVPRKWLALEKTNKAENRFVDPGTILVTCSGAVGRATLASEATSSTLISHDLLRVEPRAGQWRGWVFAFLRSPQGRSMMNSAQYGHIIKHLETTHLDALPMPTISEHLADDFAAKMNEVLVLRNRAHSITLEAEQKFESAFGPVTVGNWGESGFSVSAKEAFFGGRRRFEAYKHNPGAAEVKAHLGKKGHSFIAIEDAGFDVWLPTRFKRIPASDGVWMLDSSDLFEVNPELTKRIADGEFGDPYQGRVKAGWLLLSRSGQIYGLNGTLAIATEQHENKVVSDHIMRIAPKKPKLRIGYMHTALSHPTLGRPLVKSLAYGSSIPEIDPGDFRRLEVVRLTTKQEDQIADLAEEAALARAKADALETALGEEAGVLIDKFISGSDLTKI